MFLIKVNAKLLVGYILAFKLRILKRGQIAGKQLCHLTSFHCRFYPRMAFMINIHLYDTMMHTKVLDVQGVTLYVTLYDPRYTVVIN